MVDVQKWAHPRSRSLQWITVATMLCAAAFVAAWLLWPSVRGPEAAGDRLGVALQMLLWPSLLLLGNVMVLFRVFNNENALNPLIGGETERFRLNNRVLANSVEQAVIFYPALLALSVAVPGEQWRLVPLCVTFWTIGRALYWAGYHVAPPVRAPGFELTFFTACATVGWALYYG